MKTQTLTEKILEKCDQYEALKNPSLEMESVFANEFQIHLDKRKISNKSPIEYEKEIQQELEPGKLYTSKIKPIKQELITLARQLVINFKDPMAILLMDSGPSGIVIGLNRIKKSPLIAESYAAVRILETLYTSK